MSALGPVIITPLAGNELLFRSLTGDETMNGLFEYTVQVLSKAADISLPAALGANMTIAVELSGGGQRYFNGHVTRLTRVGVFGNYFLYRLVLRPWLWFLGRSADCRIFQNKSIPDIVKKVFRKHASVSRFDESLHDYHPQPYLVQYRETDLNFVTRLLERAGISYHFVHADGEHSLVMTDGAGKRLPAPGYEKVLLLNDTQAGNAECLTSWHVSQEVVTAAYLLKDFDYLKAKAPLDAKLAPTGSGPIADGEIYDYPGMYQTQDDGEKVAALRLQESQAYFETIETSGPVRGVGAGNVFSLTGPLLTGPLSGEGSRKFLVVKAHYEIHGHSAESSGDQGAHTFNCSLSVVDADHTLRPPRNTPTPVVQGPQTAIVVGRNKQDPGKDEICTDDYGRILVRFHWERLGDAKPQDPERNSDDKDNQDAPCWLRVAQLWAGSGWGTVFIPRIGQEVMVEFLEGDPDRPIVTGRVYNNLNKPAYLDQSKINQSGIRTRSTPGGSAKNYNEIRFDDTKGSEELFVQAEKNHNVNVKADRSVTVGGSETYTVSGTRTTTVTKKDTVTLKDKHDLTVTDVVTENFNKGHYLNIFAADQNIEIEKNKTEHVVLKYALITDQEYSLTQGSTNLDFKANNAELKAGGGGTITLDSPSEIKLVVGTSTITIAKDHIEIKSATITLDAGGQKLVIDSSGATATGLQIKLNC
jgi:type VI secretion system secreted protein VgrG